jgi:hypothetical protein
MLDDMDVFLARFPDAADYFIFQSLLDETNNLAELQNMYDDLIAAERVKLHSLASADDRKDAISLLQLLQPQATPTALLCALRECRFSVLDASVVINFRRSRARAPDTELGP